MFSKKIFFFLLITFFNFSLQLLLFSEESQLFYNKPKTYQLNLKDFLKKTATQF